MNAEIQKIQMSISHHQIQVRSRAYAEEWCQWGDSNIEQGAIIHPGYITFDPLIEGSFEADVLLVLKDNFSLDLLSKRCYVVPFEVLELEHLEVLSVGTVVTIQIPLLGNCHYELYYEVYGEEAPFYKLTFVPVGQKVQSKVLLNDDWGGVCDHLLMEGFTN
ncbi:competence protein ComJ [Paenibacillus crassostreae]|uniref:Competence protein J (ComJ) n=1 Tax=Paenibacillus crassostreae TaxID=1763538 RepID=A0A162RSR7_9BACL|nr:competence protein ComJ [Paenibacillus crassostreae]AOZ91334.1 hypothetical protein LPB68_03360 [Paenibacillus crassostreae]OAB74507.1 hypothetical protein PNBC_10600 [Paenibacillus crassostreae]